MAFKMNGWSAFTKGDGPLYKKEVKKRWRRNGSIYKNSRRSWT